jgi:hypothetical protein
MMMVMPMMMMLLMLMEVQTSRTGLYIVEQFRRLASCWCVTATLTSRWCVVKAMLPWSVCWRCCCCC